MTPCSLQDTPVVITAHAPIHDPDNPAQFPIVEILLNLIDTLCIVLVAGQDPTPHRDTFPCHSQTDGDDFYLEIENGNYKTKDD